MNILECKNLTKTYGSGSNKVVALDGVNLALEKGSFTAVVGASGSGKSTLLHMLGGVDRPTKGNIYIEDTDISTLSLEQLAVFRRRKVGLVYQFYNLIPTLNVRKNILLPILLDGQKPDEDRFLKITSALGLTDRLTHLPMELLKFSNQQYQQTILLITHDEKIALMADRILTLEDGKIIRDEVVS